MKDEGLENKLRDQLKQQADNIIFYRGVEYFNNNRVGKFSVYEDKYSKGVIELVYDVLGVSDYEVSILFDTKNENLIDFECDCPYQFFCKHSVAGGLEFIEMIGVFIDEKEVHQTRQTFKSWLMAYDKNLQEYQNNKIDNEKSIQKVCKKDFKEKYEIIVEVGYDIEFKIRKKESSVENVYYGHYYNEYILENIYNTRGRCI